MHGLPEAALARAPSARAIEDDPLPAAPVGLAAAPAAASVRPAVDPLTPGWLRPLAQALLLVNRAMVVLGMLALVGAALILSSSVLTRYFLHASTDWQDEAAVFCLVGATFLTAAFVQAIRGHIGIEAVASVLGPRANAWRLLGVDLGSLAFCTFFAWKSCTLLHEAWSEGQTTSSTWAPPLWIPYALMAGGMVLLALQLVVQCGADVNRVRRGGTPPAAPSHGGP